MITLLVASSYRWALSLRLVSMTLSRPPVAATVSSRKVASEEMAGPGAFWASYTVTVPLA